MIVSALTQSCNSAASVFAQRPLVGLQHPRSPTHSHPPDWRPFAHLRDCSSRPTETRLKATAKASSNGGSEGLEKAGPNVLKLFGETQRNLLELNRSRLNALDELRMAKNKIADLETRLDSAHDFLANQNGQTEQSQDLPPAADAHQANGASIITVSYVTGWNTVMLHYSADGQAWSELPGVPMEAEEDEDAGIKVLQIKGNRLEFVLNNGKGQWDTPNPYGNEACKNYVIDSPGNYRLEAGKLHKLS